MAQLFAKHELDVVTLPYENCLVVIGSYTGNTDLDVDKAAADVELAKLFPGRFQESCTEDVSANTATLANGAYDSGLTAMVYKNGNLLAESTYTATPGTGVFSAFSPALTADDIILATLVKPVFGVNQVEPVAEFPVKVEDVKSIGTTDYVYRTQTYEDAKYTINIKGTYDVRKLRRSYPANELEKAIFGAQWDETSDVANLVGRNTNPFFVAVIWWIPTAGSGELKIEKRIFYGCTLQKDFAPKPEGVDKAASFEIDASALYVYRIKTLAA